MARSVQIGLRVTPEVKAAVEQAAKDDHRPVASLIEKLLIEWLAAKSYLSTSKGPVQGRLEV
jgi:hypothetical protein